MILQFLWESRGRLFKESYSNVTLLFFVFVHIAPYLLYKTHQSCVAVREVLSPQLVFSHCAKSPALSAQNSTKINGVVVICVVARLVNSSHT